MAAVLSVTNLEQFQVGINMLQTVKRSLHLLHEPGHFIYVLKTWRAPFSGVSIIANWEMIGHRDISGSPHWYDILITMGQYTGMKFHLPSLNVALLYKPRNIITIAEKVLPHSVDPVESGDRVCFAWFL